MTPEEVHQLGLEQVADLEAPLDPILRAHGLTQGTAGARLTALNQAPEQLYPNPDEGRAAPPAQLNHQIVPMHATLPEAFPTLPKHDAAVRRVPPPTPPAAPRRSSANP